MLYPLLEAYSPIDGTYNVHTDIVDAVSTALTNTAALELQTPYGEATTGYVAGMICQLKAETSGVTAIVLSDADRPIGIFASNYTDAVKSGKADFYYLCGNLKCKVQGCYDTGQTYAVNTLLTVIGSGTNKGKMTPATNYATQPIVAMVMQPPATASDDDPMVIITISQVEGVS